MMGWCSGGAGYFGLMHLAWWALIIVGIVVLLRWLPGAGRGSQRSELDRSLIILRERYARGEIDKADFDTRKRDLG
jgi:putative membrane protein